MLPSFSNGLTITELSVELSIMKTMNAMANDINSECRVVSESPLSMYSGLVAVN